MEIWKPIPIKGFENYYEVSNYGNVRSLDRVIITKNGRYYRRSGGLMKMQVNKVSKLLQVMLSCHKRYKLCYIHRLVADAFLEKPEDENKKFITHLDGNLLNNHVENLAYITMKEIVNNYLNRKRNG